MIASTKDFSSSCSASERADACSLCRNKDYVHFLFAVNSGFDYFFFEELAKWPGGQTRCRQVSAAVGD
jgi:hypothetical protein